MAAEGKPADDQPAIPTLRDILQGKWIVIGHFHYRGRFEYVDLPFYIAYGLHSWIFDGKTVTFRGGENGETHVKYAVKGNRLIIKSIPCEYSFSVKGERATFYRMEPVGKRRVTTMRIELIRFQAELDVLDYLDIKETECRNAIENGTVLQDNNWWDNFLDHEEQRMPQDASINPEAFLEDEMTADSPIRGTWVMLGYFRWIQGPYTAGQWSWNREYAEAPYYEVWKIRGGFITFYYVDAVERNTIEIKEDRLLVFSDDNDEQKHDTYVASFFKQRMYLTLLRRDGEPDRVYIFERFAYLYCLPYIEQCEYVKYRLSKKKKVKWTERIECDDRSHIKIRSSEN